MKGPCPDLEAVLHQSSYHKIVADLKSHTHVASNGVAFKPGSCMSASLQLNFAVNLLRSTNLTTQRSFGFYV